MLRICVKCTVLHADSENTVENRFKACFRIVFQDFRFSICSCFELLNQATFLISFYRMMKNAENRCKMYSFAC